jgi:hypothetical protein
VSGLGISARFKGFRLGVKPTGRAYVMGGRHGLYFRKSLPTAPSVSPARQESIPHSSAAAKIERVMLSPEARAWATNVYRDIHEEADRLQRGLDGVSRATLLALSGDEHR